ncbi:hypothetical protein AOQ84DRAFT_31063 [Glonium stellatum]|uniref:Uncharacterized protein n=1 Tax=Glonium stellatum TaxID=574774 RepID=A0A8E2JTI9_9PEZI|nr:hypothetical protein AOQ84DRAFT_31063 [Glonium stellatum]
MSDFSGQSSSQLKRRLDIYQRPDFKDSRPQPDRHAILSQDLRGVGDWGQTQTSGNEGEEYPPNLDDDVLESTAQSGASPESGVSGNEHQQHTGGPPTPVDTPTRSGFDPQSSSYLPQPIKTPPTPTSPTHAKGDRPNRLDPEQGSSNASETGYSNWQANMRSPNSSTSYGETNHEDGPNHEGGRDHNNYASSNRTPSYKSGDEPNGGNQSTGQPVSQHNAPQSPYPYSEWDRYDSTQALNEVEKFK